MSILFGCDANFPLQGGPNYFSGAVEGRSGLFLWLSVSASMPTSRKIKQLERKAASNAHHNNLWGPAGGDCPGRILNGGRRGPGEIGREGWGRMGSPAPRVGGGGGTEERDLAPH